MRKLSKVRILITRPRHQCSGLMRLLRECGAEPVRFPVIEIRDRHRHPDNLAKVRRIDLYQLLIFISRNAVEYGLKLLAFTGVSSANLPAVAAIGIGTAAFLEQRRLTVSACPQQPNSEMLAQTATVRNLPAGSRALIFRGKGGKEVLAQILGERGIQCTYAEVYERVKPETEPLVLDPPPKLIMVTSSDSLRNLYELTHPNHIDTLLQTSLLLGSRTMKELHKSLGFKQPPIIARSPLDEDMVAAAAAWMHKV